ncbi:MAG TPA: PRTRC system protein E [Terriglobales bacterium]|nr:PRTRC system protein E [Terriglobales bacterium]
MTSILKFQSCKPTEKPRREETVFVELMPLLKDRTLLITIARVEEKLKVNVIPAKIKDGEDHALTTPLSFTGSAEELDSELGRHLASYVDSHLALGNTLAEAKAEMDATAKAARQKVKTTQQASKPDPAVAKKDEPPRPTAPAADTTPSLFAAQQSAEPTTQAPGEEGGKATS